MKKKSKIFVAGHRGLVGSAILKNLQEKGYFNLVVRTHNVLDLKDQEAVKAFFDAEEPEYVVLAAAKVGGIMANSIYRGQFIYENLQIQNNVIHQSYLHGVKKLLFLGSTCIYPKMAPQPMKEDCLLTDELEYTNEPYAIAKIAGLKMCEAYNMQYGTNYISVMPTNLYGPNDNFDLETSHVLPAMVRKIHLAKCLEEGDWEGLREDLGMRNEEEILRMLKKYGIEKYPQMLTDEDTDEKMDKKTLLQNDVKLALWGSGEPLREFLWSEDMADACVFLLENRDFKDVVVETKGQKGGKSEIRNSHINIGTGKELTIKELACLIKKEIGYKGIIEFDASKPDGTMRKLTDPAKLHGLGWKHKVELEEGIKLMYHHYLNI